MFAIRHTVNACVQPSYDLRYVSIVVRFKLHGCGSRGHQECGGNSFAGYVGNDDLDRVRVDGDTVVVIAAHAPRCLHHAGYFEPGNGWFVHGKKKALNFRGQHQVVKEVVTLFFNRFGQVFPLLDIPLDDVNDKGEAQHRGEMVEDAKPKADISGGVIVMEQDTDRDEAIADFPAQENCTDGKREDVEVEKRNRNNEVVRIRYSANRPEDQHEWEPRGSVGAHIPPQEKQQRYALA